jgi:hypothetical protein
MIATTPMGTAILLRLFALTAPSGQWGLAAA